MSKFLTIYAKVKFEQIFALHLGDRDLDFQCCSEILKKLIEILVSKVLPKTFPFLGGEGVAEKPGWKSYPAYR